MIDIFFLGLVLGNLDEPQEWDKNNIMKYVKPKLSCINLSGSDAYCEDGSTALTTPACQTGDGVSLNKCEPGLFTQASHCTTGNFAKACGCENGKTAYGTVT